jgi:hypothetical protein
MHCGGHVRNAICQNRKTYEACRTKYCTVAFIKDEWWMKYIRCTKHRITAAIVCISWRLCTESSSHPVLKNRRSRKGERSGIYLLRLFISKILKILFHDCWSQLPRGLYELSQAAHIQREWVRVLIVHLCTKTNSMVWVRERTIPTERPPLVGEAIANFCG